MRFIKYYFIPLALALLTIYFVYEDDSIKADYNYGLIITFLIAVVMYIRMLFTYLRGNDDYTDKKEKQQ